VNLNISEWAPYSALPSGEGQYLTLGVPERSVERILPPYKVYYYTDTLNFIPKGPVKKGLE